MSTIQLGNLTITPSLLYRTSATLFALAVPGHILLGSSKVRPALRRLATASETYRSKAAGQQQLLRDERVGLQGALNSWDSWNFFGAIMALFTYQIASTPTAARTREERAILVLSALGNWLASFRYLGVGEVPAFGILTAAPAAALAGLVLEGGIEALKVW